MRTIGNLATADESTPFLTLGYDDNEGPSDRAGAPGDYCIVEPCVMTIAGGRLPQSRVGTNRYILGHVGVATYSKHSHATTVHGPHTYTYRTSESNGP